MQIFRNLIIVAVAVAFASPIIGRTDLQGKFQKVICIVHDPLILQNVSCWVKSLNWTYTLFNMRANIVRVINKAKINIQLYKKSQLTYRPFLVNVSDDYCAFFSKNRASSYLRIIWPMYMRYTNLNHTCPYYGEAIIKDLPLNSEGLPQIWPPDNYRLDIISFEGKQKVSTMQFFIEITEKRNRWQ